MSSATEAPLQARYDVIVVGAGLAGLFAGALAARRGARTLVLAGGVGGTHLGSGCIGVWGFQPDGALAASPAAVLPKLEQQADGAQPHPFALAGREALSDALAELKELCAAHGYPLAGGLDRNHWLPTALGAVRSACLAPETFAAGEVRDAREIVLGDIAGFRDFYAGHAAANLRAAGYGARALTLELPRAPRRRDLFATDLARLFDEPAYRAAVAHVWAPHLRGVERLGLPAVIGYLSGAAAWRDLSDKLGLAIFEVPLAPPSVPGMRLFNVLRAAVEDAGGRVLVGPKAQGWLAPGGGAVAGVVAATAGGPRRYAASAVILATGGFRHGGLVAPVPGQAREGVFDVPVAAEGEWFAPLYWGAHPYAAFGVRVNASMQAVDAAGEVLYPNLYAVGGLLAGARRREEGSREGIDLATAWKAVAHLRLAAPIAAVEAQP
jgi:glycerol-3-phosphate dehydrogenase subunit B